MTEKELEEAAKAALLRDVQLDLDWLVQTKQASCDPRGGYTLLVPPDKVVWPSGDWDSRS